MKRNLLIVITFFAGINSYSQIFFSDGATVQVNNGAIVFSNGGMEISNSSSFVNDGDVTVTKNSTFPTPGNFEINSTSTVSGDGNLRVEQDWINDATFNAGNSTVELFGNTEQFITSNNGTVTTFNNLTLTGVGVGNNRKKSLLNVNANTGVSGILAINDRELSTDVNSFFVLNNSTLAITNNTTPGSEGFVSSIAPGVLSRVTNVSSVYLFPTGSSVGTLRYRPIEVIPTAAVANTFTVRMINNDSNNDGFNRAVNDGVMCVLNPIYYHAINRSSGATSADIRMFYDSALDGNWSGMGHWRLSNVQWNDMATMTLGTSGVFNTVTRAAWLFANPGDPYILTNPAPTQPNINCPIVCENSSNNIFTASGTNNSFDWVLPNNGTIVSGQGNDTLSVNWGTGTGYVYVYNVDPSSGCQSLPDSCLVTVLPAPDASFTASSSGVYNDNYIFLDQSTGAVSWDWYFGDPDGNTSSSQNTGFLYETTGIYDVSLVVTNAAGCTDSVTVQITVGGIVVPNVFSPNGDLINDGFGIQTSGLTEYKLSIYDRWGLLMFESTDVNQFWDGKNLDNKLCPDGTYYYILKAVSTIDDWSRAGHLTLLTQR